MGVGRAPAPIQVRHCGTRLSWSLFCLCGLCPPSHGCFVCPPCPVPLPITVAKAVQPCLPGAVKRCKRSLALLVAAKSLRLSILILAARMAGRQPVLD
jgi:hypothetical protein